MRILHKKQTFDNVWEASEINYQYLFARAVFFQQKRQPEPPPLNVLRLPALAVYWSFKLLSLPFEATADGSTSKEMLRRITEWLASGFTYSPFIYTDVARNIQVHAKREEGMMPEYVGTTIGTRNTYDSWRNGTDEEDLLENIENHINDHVDEVAQQERWRSKFLQRITRAVSQSEDAVQEQLSKQQATLDQVREALDALLKKEKSV